MIQPRASDPGALAQLFRLGSRDRKRAENARPAKNVEAARALWPERMANMAEAVQQANITAMQSSISVRRSAGSFTMERFARM